MGWSYRVAVNITKTYFMLSVSDMDQAVGFYRDVIGLTVDFESPFWSELHWRDATIALHGGGTDEERESGLGFHVTDLDAALAEMEPAGAQRGEEQPRAVHAWSGWSIPSGTGSRSEEASPRTAAECRASAQGGDPGRTTIAAPPGSGHRAARPPQLAGVSWSPPLLAGNTRRRA